MTTPLFAMTLLNTSRATVYLVLVAVLAACSGGETRTETLQATAASQPGTPSLGERMRALTVGGGSTAAAAVNISNAQFFQWATLQFAALFPAYSVPLSLTSEGLTWDIRAYSNGNYLAVASDGHAYGLGPVTGNTLVDLGVVQAFAEQVCGSVGCGGGGGEGAGTVSLRGTVATGAALPGAAVYVNCADGSVTGARALVGDDGTYSITLNAAKMPCVAKAVSQDNHVELHAALNPAGGSTQTLNINPLTELILARLTGAPPQFVWSSFNSAAASMVNSQDLVSATIDTVATLKDRGYADFSTVGNPMTAPLVARTASSPGNAYDQILDALGARTAGFGQSLADLTQSALTDHSRAVWNTMDSSTGTLQVDGGKTYALRALQIIDTTGIVRGGGYNFYTLDGTLTPCTPGGANAATCMGAQDNFNLGSQSGPLTVAGAAPGTRLQAGPDGSGYLFIGTISGTTWSGTFTKAATATSPGTSTGTFNVNLKIALSLVGSTP